MNQSRLPSHGKGELCCYSWNPACAPRAIVQLVHGIAEHSLRYDAFAQYLASCGILVVSEDHMGHGASIDNTQPRCYFHGGWDAAVDDIYALMLQTKADFPDVPYFLFGHSMGSFLTRTFLIKYPDAGLCGAILSGTAWQNPAVLAAGLTVCCIEAARIGRKSVSKLLNKMAFGTYNRHFKPSRTPHDWINSLPEEVDLYQSDPLCGFDATVGIAQDMLRAIKRIQQPELLKKMNRALPVFFIAGKDDPVGNMGKGVIKAADAFSRVGMCKVQHTLYGGRHEILRDKDKAQVFRDILDFIACHI